MDAEQIRDHCLGKTGVSEGFPFGEETLVFKVKEKIFALVSLDGPLSINLKCDPEKAIELRESYPCVLPGYHMNKTHWNTVVLDGSVPNRLIMDWIDHSYLLVRNSLPVRIKDELNRQEIGKPTKGPRK